jgi:hypothetical protein
MSLARTVTLSLALMATAFTGCSVVADEIVGNQILSDRTFYTLLAIAAVLWGIFAALIIRDYVASAVVRKVNENATMDRRIAQEYMIQLGMISDSAGQRTETSYPKGDRRDGEETPLRQCRR